MLKAKVNGKLVIEKVISAREGFGPKLYLVASICSKGMTTGNHWASRPVHRGAFDSAQKAFENIEKYGSCLFECAYDFLIVEEKWQGFDSCPSKEFWFKWNAPGGTIYSSDNSDDFGYEPTERPAWAEGAICWN